MAVQVKTILRIIELIICVILVILWYVWNGYSLHVMIVCGTVFGFLIITPVIVALEFTEFKDVPVFLIIGGVLFIICGAITAGTLPDSDHDKWNPIIVMLLLFTNGVIFIADFIMEIINK